MIKKILLLIVLLITFSKVNAQIYGNEWINYNQKYYKFNITSNGIYKLDYATLYAADTNIKTIPTKYFQIFGKEREVPLMIEDGGNDTLEAGEYILFYAERNDGWLDSTLYNQVTDIGNPYYSLFNDTLQYFFTWNNLPNNLRFTPENDINFDNYNQTNFIIKKTETYYTSYYLDGERLDHESSSYFTAGEGWGTGRYNIGQTLNLSINTNHLYVGNDAPLPNFNASSVTLTNAGYTGIGNHHTTWQIGPNDYPLTDQIVIGMKQIYVNTTFPITELTPNSTALKFSIVNDQGAVTDDQAINFWAVSYPADPNLDNSSTSTFWVKNSPSQSKIKLKLTNVNNASPIIFVLGSEPKTINLTNINNEYYTLIPNSTDNLNQKIVYQNFNTIASISNLKPVSETGLFTDYPSYNADLALLMIYHHKLDSSSLEYASYRNSVEGGHYNVVLADIEELYLQFGGGINKHINSIRRFAHYMYNKSTDKPVGLYLLGKGTMSTQSGSTNFPQTFRQNSSVYNLNLIPTFGEPNSDIAITSNLEGNGWAPLIPTGRLSVNSNTQLNNYLNKVKAYEQQQDTNFTSSISDLDWKKHVIHLGGGSDDSQQVLFQGYLNQMEVIIEDSNYAANVMRVYKTSTQPLDLDILSEVSDRIENGISLMTFFGHEGPTASGFEINLDNPNNWNNTNKYPVVLSNSCFNGNMFTTTASASENFVNAVNSGAIAFTSPVYQGVSSSLAIFSKELYREFSTNNYYGKPLGFQIKKAISKLDLISNSLGIETTTQQMALNGDPMIHLNYYPKPEIELVEQNISFTNESFDLNTPFVNMQVILTNYGKAITDTFKLEIKRDFPLTNIDSVYTFDIPKLNYKDTFIFQFPLQANIASGLNTFYLSADIPNFITEQFEEFSNNQISKQLLLDIDGILPVLPYDFAVVPNDTLTLTASTINPIADFNTYRFEVDTTDLFDSPMHKYQIVTGLGGLKYATPENWKDYTTNSLSPLYLIDSMVYFWRVAIDEPNPIWREQSFQYIEGKTGWGQDHFFQYKKNNFNGIVYDRTIRKKLFGPNLGNIKCINQTYLSSTLQYLINDEMQDYAVCTTTPSIHVAVIDPITLKPWGTYNCPQTTPGCNCTPINVNHQFGNANNGCGSCRTRVEKYFIFRQTSASQLDAFKNMIETQIPDGYYVLIYTPVMAYFDNWNSLSPSIFTMFQNLGADSITPTSPNEPFSFFFKKGDPTSAVEMFANGQSQFTLDVNIIGFDYEGIETSTLIGPASNWGNVYWKQDPYEGIIGNDTTRLKIKGYDYYGTEQIAIDTLFSANDSLMNLNNLIPANQYPFIKLESFYHDSIQFTPAQIDRWHVLYSPVPEAAIDNSVTPYTWLPLKDTLDQGENIKFAIDIKNIYNLPMDSLLVNYWIEDEYHNKIPIQYNRQDSLTVGETFRDTIEIVTENIPGRNILWMEVNPYINGSLYITDQPEQQHFNNLLEIPFYINQEDKNPILDVSFDGRHILNGDIISPKSEVVITLKDENEYLVMDKDADTSLFSVYLTDPDGIMSRIYFKDNNGNVIMQWTPANVQNKKFKINYLGNFTKDGKYSILIQGSDKSGNLSGDMQYKISFEIIHKSSISYLMNYPNPFSTNTKFVFTLTGEEVPDRMFIQIMTVSGKVVREITQEELGPIYIGRNITEFSWDGTDNFGDKLANGIYLYTVKSELHGENIEHRTTEGDTYFKKEFGKMYILR
ncbi:MAG: hypothetical protein HYR91_14320 [Flavobacteriia bacterium]|nr:hypothetical protein [Flavobacteriia bacterium]